MAKLEIDGSTGIPMNLKVVQKMIAMRPVFEIYDEDTGRKMAVVRQTWLSFLRSTMHMEDEMGNVILTAKGGFFDKSFSLIEDGEVTARVTRPWFALRKSFELFYQDDIIKAQGGILALGFDAVDTLGRMMFRLDKKIFALRDQYRGTVDENMDWRHAVMTAIIVDRVFFKSGGCCCGNTCCACLILIVALFALLMLLMAIGS